MQKNKDRKITLACSFPAWRRRTLVSVHVQVVIICSCFPPSGVSCATWSPLFCLHSPWKKKRKNNHCSVQAIVVTVILTTCTEVTCDVLTTCNIPASAGSLRLRVVPHFSSGKVEQAKRERAWKSPHACRLFSRGEIFTRARFSLALLSLS